MDKVLLVSQVLIALGLLNVWLLRRNKATPWRGGEARTMKEEFQEYGLPGWFMGTIGVLKVSLALALLAGLWLPGVTTVSAIGIASLMAGAVVMHVKVGDPMRKSAPAFSLLVLSLIVGLS
jgi:hypothetical protein